MATSISKTLTVISPAYEERDNIRPMFEALSSAMEPLGMEWEWLVIDDASTDGTFGELKKLHREYDRVKVIRLARNSGSHNAIFCGLAHVNSDVLVIVSSDLQDPPELIQKLVERWRSGADVVWAQRTCRDDVKWSDAFFAKLYYRVVGRLGGFHRSADFGSDFVLIDRRVASAMSKFSERNISVFALINWLGFEQSEVEYERQRRYSGSSGWTLWKKVNMFVDGVVAFSVLPIRLISAAGILIALISFLYGSFVLALSLFGNVPIPGWTSLMLVAIFVGGLQIFMLGFLGEYIWRILDETRRRPRFTVERFLGTGSDNSSNFEDVRRSSKEGLT